MSRTLLTPGEELLYLCSGWKAERIDTKKIQYLARTLEDWDRFLQKARYHRLLPRLYFLLERGHASAFLPPETWKKIQAVYYKAQAEVLAHEGVFRILLPLFNRAGIDVMLIKGAALLQTVYREKPVRFLLDIDLLVRRENFLRAQALLEEQRYQKMETRSFFPSVWHDKELGDKMEKVAATYVHPDTKTTIDLHREAFGELDFFRFKPDWLWREAQPAFIDGQKVFLPHPTNLFLHVLFHLVRSAGSEENFFGWYLDLDECLRYFSDEIDGSFCREIILSNPQTKQVLSILIFLKTVLCSPLPGELESLIQGGNTNPIFLRSIFSCGDKFSRSTDPYWKDRREVFLFYWSRISGFRKKFLFIWHWLFPDPFYLETKYPFGNGSEKALAYLRHLGAMVLKGIHLLRRCGGRSVSRRKRYGGTSGRSSKH